MGGEFERDVEENRWARILMWCRLENLILLSFFSFGSSVSVVPILLDSVAFHFWHFGAD